MLETPQERVELLRAGFSGKSIEKLYVQGNNFKIVSSSTFFELVEVNFPSCGAKGSVSDSCLVELFN